MARKASHCNDTVRPKSAIEYRFDREWLNQLGNYLAFRIVHWSQVIKMTVQHKNSICPANIVGLHMIVFVWLDIIEVFGTCIQVKQRCLGQAATCWIE
jgi:hypothetical protein